MRLIGHRGARGEAPENTLGGFAYLQALGIRAVELDVRRIADGTLVVIHDDCLSRTTGEAFPVARLQQQHLRQHNHCLNWPDWPSPEPTPTLDQVLGLLEEFEHIELELKPVSSETQANLLVNQVLDQVRGWQDTVVLTSFDPRILRALQRSGTALRRGLLLERWGDLPTDQGQAKIELAQRLGCVQMGLHDPLCSGRVVDAIHQAELSCSEWTVNDPDRAHQLGYWGVDGLITDYPQRMLAAGLPRS